MQSVIQAQGSVLLLAFPLIISRKLTMAAINPAICTVLLVLDYTNDLHLILGISVPHARSSLKHSKKICVSHLSARHGHKQLTSVSMRANMHVKWLTPVSCWACAGLCMPVASEGSFLSTSSSSSFSLALKVLILASTFTPLLQFTVVSLHVDRSGGGAMFIAFGQYKSGDMSTDICALIMYK